MGDLFAWVGLLIEVFDYLIKAAVNFRDTEEGAPEWQQIVDRFEVITNNGSNQGVTFGVENSADVRSSASEPAQPTRRNRAANTEPQSRVSRVVVSE